MRPVTAPLVAIVLLAAWLGAALCVSALVAPAAFAVLPSRAVAGALIGRVLPVLFWSAIALGVGVAASGFSTPDARAWRTSTALLVAASAAVAQFVIAPRIALLRADIAGPVDALAASDPARLAFGRLHGLSVACLGLGMAAAVVTLGLQIRLVIRSTT